MTLKQEKDLPSKIEKMKAVCPVCRNEFGENNSIFIYDGATVWNQDKLYQCSSGHIISVSAFTNKMIHVAYNKGHENIEGTIEELNELVDNGVIFCHNVDENDCSCGKAVKPIDDFSLNYPVANNIKTKTRVGDIWAKAGAEPVRNGSYDSDGHYHSTRTERINKERVSRLREKAKRSKKK